MDSGLILINRSKAFKRPTINRFVCSLALVPSLLVFSSLGFAAEKELDQVINKGIQRSELSKQAEESISKVDKNLKTKKQVYSGLLKENEGLRVYIKQLEKQIENQLEESKQIETSIVQAAQMERQVVPLMLRMVASLDALLEVDMPFKKTLRREKVEGLKTIISRSDVSVAEKYRKVLEVYQNEMEYGRTIEAYREELVLNDKVQQVDILRVGRISLVYLSLDGNQIGAWNKKQGAWQEIDSNYKPKIQKAIKIAREQAAPELIKIPLEMSSL